MTKEIKERDMVAEEAKFDKKYSYLTPGVREQLKREKLYGEIPSCPKDVYVSMQNINKVYENGFHAVHDFNLDIKQHEFIVFVGPSGCGKSTSLRMIAGLEEITAGHLFIDGERVNDYSPKDRNIAMVFQSYALYPHMTVYGNMAYSLKINKFHIRGLTIKEKAKFEKQINNLKSRIENAQNEEEKKNYQSLVEAKEKERDELDQKIRYRHLTPKEIDERVQEGARILQIEKLLDRKPKALSGGQRQRVALGRAIVRNAKVFLMDEPLSNLDAKLRVQMRSEIVNLHNKINATTIYVTHDQTEAMTMATRIVIMKDGFVQQIGTPIEIFNHPANLFVASFIGSPAMNFFNVKYDKKNNSLAFENGAKIILPEEFKKKPLLPEMVLGVRPEHILDADNGAAKTMSKESAFEVSVELTELLGSEYYLHNDFGGIKFVSKQEANRPINKGDKLKLIFNMDKIHLFNPETEEAIY